MKKQVACTIVSANYFAFARTVAQSFLAKHPEDEFIVLVVDRRNENIDADANSAGLRVLYVGDLQIPDFKSVSFKYDILELNTNVKPTFLKRLLRDGFDKVIYFDPDIYIYESVEFIYKLLDSSNIVVTPHATSPILDMERPADQDFLATGTFNLGFIALNASDEARRFLDWWETRCLQLAYAETRTGLFVDQKWLDLAPCYFDGLLVLKHKGCNVANWNFHERTLKEVHGKWSVNGEPLVFFHFSGIDVLAKLQISKHQKKVTCENRPEVRGLFDAYRKQVLANDYMKYIGIPYGFGGFSNGLSIPQIARRIYSIYQDELACSNPFDDSGEFYKFAVSLRLLKGDDLAGSINSQNCNRNDRYLRIINAALRLTLKVIGGGRYTMLMKYLSYISILRNQRDVIGLKIS